jgi:hypothetical protein
MGKSQSKVDLYAAIRRDHRGGLTQRALQRKYNVTWRTLRHPAETGLHVRALVELGVEGVSQKPLRIYRQRRRVAP